MKHLKPHLKSFEYWAFFVVFAYVLSVGLSFLPQQNTTIVHILVSLGVTQTTMVVIFFIDAITMFFSYGLWGSVRVSSAIASFPAILLAIVIVIGTLTTQALSLINGVNAIFIVILIWFCLFLITQVEARDDKIRYLSTKIPTETPHDPS